MLTLRQIFYKCINENLGSCLKSFLCKFVNLLDKLGIKTEVKGLFHFRTILLNLVSRLLKVRTSLIFVHKFAIRIIETVSSLLLCPSRQWLVRCLVFGEILNTGRYLIQRKQAKGKIKELIFFSLRTPKIC